MRAYIYASNSPLLLLDPLGLFAIKEGDILRYDPENYKKLFPKGDVPNSPHCGVFWWPVKFTFSDNDAFPFFLVQKVTWKFKLGTCGCGKQVFWQRSGKCPKMVLTTDGDAEDFTFYEIWTVKSKDRITSGQTSENLANDAYQDAFSNPKAGPSTYSDDALTITGEFFKLPAISDGAITTPSGGWKNWPAKGVGSVAPYSVCEDDLPKQVKKDLIPLNVSRSIKAKWECCPDPSDADSYVRTVNNVKDAE